MGSIYFPISGQLFTLSNPEDAPADDLVSDQDLVMVTVSYRINAFGFLCTEDETVPGNMGLKGIMIFQFRLYLPDLV